MRELEITWRRVLSVWWLVAWRTLGGAVIIGFILGVAFVVAMAAIGVPRQIRDEVMGVASLTFFPFLGIVWGVLMFRSAFNKSYRDFRLAMLAKNSN